MHYDAIPAATLVTMRPAAVGGPPEILIVRRTARMAFAAGMVVFPGGRVDQADRDLASAMGRTDAAAHVTAIRETLDETGVAVGLGPLDPAIGPVLQDALLGGVPFARLIEREGLSIDLDALTPFARWMPAFKQPRKFDTLFLLAEAAPGEWQPRPQPGECEAAQWASAQTILDRIDQGAEGAIFPTKRNLERLARFATHDEAIRDAASHSLETIIPWVEARNGEDHVVIPEGRGYPVTAEPLRTAFRA